MKKGFTLVELSIVLVIIGLIVAGVVMGRDLVRNFQIRDLIGQYEEYVAAINTFKGKYDELPGDSDRMSVFFGQLSSGTCLDTTASDGTTCSGDGDGFIEYTATSAGGGTVREGFRFWEHLGLAGMYGGAYTGFPHPGGNAFNHFPGANAPETAFDGVTFGIGHVGAIGGTYHSQNFISEGTNTHIFEVGNASDPANNVPGGEFLTPQEMFTMDSKMDDGAPGMGIMQARFDSGCSTSNNDVDKITAEYVLGTTTVECAIIFDLGPLQ